MFLDFFDLRFFFRGVTCPGLFFKYLGAFEQDIIVKIDKGDYVFYTTKDLPDAAWTDEDSKVIFAMKKGLELTVIGESSRGTMTNDTYTLKGFTAAYNKLVEDC